MLNNVRFVGIIRAIEAKVSHENAITLDRFMYAVHKSNAHRAIITYLIDHVRDVSRVNQVCLFTYSNGSIIFELPYANQLIDMTPTKLNIERSQLTDGYLSIMEALHDNKSRFYDIKLGNYVDGMSCMPRVDEHVFPKAWKTLDAMYEYVRKVAPDRLHVTICTSHISLTPRPLPITKTSKFLEGINMFETALVYAMIHK